MKTDEKQTFFNMTTSQYVSLYPKTGQKNNKTLTNNEIIIDIFRIFHDNLTHNGLGSRVQEI